MSSFDATNTWFPREKKSEQIIDDNTELDMYQGEIHGCLVAHLNRGSQVCTSLFVSLSPSFLRRGRCLHEGAYLHSLLETIGIEASLTRRAILKNATCFPLPLPPLSLPPYLS